MLNFDLKEALLMLPAVLFGFSAHEFCHAYVATKMGDSTPSEQGRLTLNPLSHIDLIGFLLIFFAGFGWAKPVQTNPHAYKNPRRDDILVSLAGPVANLIIAVFFVVGLKLLMVYGRELPNIQAYGRELFAMVNYFVWINLILTFFNLLPIPPLDGSHILFDILPERFITFKEQFFKFGSILLLFIILIENNSKINILPIGKITQIIYNGLFRALGI